MSTAPLKTAFETKAPVMVSQGRAAQATAHVVFAHSGKDGKIVLSSAAHDIDKASKGTLTAAAEVEKFTGKVGQAMCLNMGSGRTVILAGLGGDKTPLTGVDVDKIGTALCSAALARTVSALVIDSAADIKATGLDQAEVADRLALALQLCTYRFDKYKTKGGKAKKQDLASVTVVTPAAAAARKLFADSQKLAAGVFLTRDLVTEVPNVLYPESFAAIIKKELTPLGITVKILDVPAMKKLGMNSLLGVGQGSARPPRLVTMAYNGGKKGQKPVALVGKGVTFDTGGISLKPGPGMEDMKYDMAGAGAVVGAMKALAGRKAKANVVGVVALAENMPSGNASRPSDVVTSMSGITIENLNTDAEGRLILCDALTYTQRFFKPSHIVDLATLTGAVLIALGEEFGGLFSNDDGFAATLRDAGDAVGECLWQMPLHDNWDKSIDSQIADVKNIAAHRFAGSAIGAHFLKRFIEPGVTWAHLDIAGMAWSNKGKACAPAGATAFGVRLLDRYVHDSVEA